MSSFLRFLQFNNAVPIAFSILVLGAGSAFAASNPETIYSTSQTVVSDDNSYLLGKDFSAYTPIALITAVTEDTDTYYVAYKLTTIDLADHAWRDVVKDAVIKVNKADLGPYRDLGVYVTEQLSQVVDRELARLRDTQSIQKSEVTQKVVVTTYSGLVGKMLDARTDVLPGYTPVITEPEPQVAAVGATDPSPTDATQNPSQDAAANWRIQVLGDNAPRIVLGTDYSDLGAVISNPAYSNIPVKTYMNGREVTRIVVDTTKPGEFVVLYQATDESGHMESAQRLITVFDAADVAPEPTPEPEPESQPEPEPQSEPEQTPAEETSTSDEETPAASSGPVDVPAPTPAEPASE